MISNETMVLIKKNCSVHGFICTLLCLFYSTNSHLGFVAVLHVLTVYQLLICVMSTEDLINPDFPLILVSGRPYWSVASLPLKLVAFVSPVRIAMLCPQSTVWVVFLVQNLWNNNNTPAVQKFNFSVNRFFICSQ